MSKCQTPLETHLEKYIGDAIMLHIDVHVVFNNSLIPLVQAQRVVKS